MTLQSVPATRPPSVRPADLALEANHRIANHLSMLVAVVRGQLPVIEAGPLTMPRELVADLLNDMADKILSVARLHRMLANQPAPGEVELGKVLMEAARELQSSGIFADRLHVTSSLDGCLVEASQASMLLMALSEIATNAIKYAHPTGLPVELTIAGTAMPDDGVQLEIADDGVGFPEGFDEWRDAGIGLKLVRTLVERAGGCVAMKSDPLGLTFAIQLPPHKPCRA
jgi:two-component sensor histidine kinase